MDNCHLCAKTISLYLFGNKLFQQVRLFLSEECPSQVGMGAQDHLQAKASWASHPSSIMSDDNLPPGFEGTQPVNHFMTQLSQIPVIKWRCPPKVSNFSLL